MRSYNRGRTLKALLAIVCAAAVGIFGAFYAVRVLYPMEYSDIISKSCEEFGVEESLVYAVIHTESGFDRQARSNVGALGLMQIMPETFEWLQKGLPAPVPLESSALLEPEVNIRYGVYYLSRLHDQFGSDMLTIAAYHAGQGAVGRWLSDPELSGDGFTRQDIPSSATAHYVDKVERAREIYERLYF